MKSPELSVVIPAYNEGQRLSEALRKIDRYFASRAIHCEILVVDDGSTDNTAQVVREAMRAKSAGYCRLSLIQNERNRGKGFSVRRGMLRVRGRWALLTDADLSTPIEEYEKLERAVVDGPFDAAIGSRDVEGSQVEVHQSRLRESSGKFYNLLVRTLLGLPFRDTQCGFKLFDLQRCIKIFSQQQIDRFGFDVELLVLARRMGLSVKETPVVWRHNEGSKVHFVKDGAGMMFDLAKICVKKLTGQYG